VARFFSLRDTVDQMRSIQSVKHWIVAVEGSFCVFYDTTAYDFGSVESPGTGIQPATIAVWVTPVNALSSLSIPLIAVLIAVISRVAVQGGAVRGGMPVACAFSS
jgi:L-cystine uptake protein TcyP (sodium:dicarboxylate symporter family)